jgi:UDP-N-acetylglucosamine 1-carboxyvinyltransferase
MERMLVRANGPLEGAVDVRGAKNAALPIMAATMLSGTPCTLRNVPNLRDTRTMVRLMRSLGADVDDLTDGVLEVRNPSPSNYIAEYELVRTMRASFFVLGSVLARMGRAKISLPGGCAIGTRPVDIHLKGLEALGAEITISEGYVEAAAPGGLRGGKVVLDFPSVGATENIMMAAVGAEGPTVIENAAREPEIEDLALFLGRLGAHIEGAGTSRISIEPNKQTDGHVEHEILADRIEAGTFLLAAAITGGDVTVRGARMDHLAALAAKMREAGVTVEETPDGVRAARTGPIHATDLITGPHPAFATDLQAQFLALLTLADGTSTVTETIFENRYMHVAELRRMGADIDLRGNMAIIRGVDRLSGAYVMASDLRASAALILAALVARGVTTIQRIYHIDRGYEHLEKRLNSIGARIIRESAEQ